MTHSVSFDRNSGVNFVRIFQLYGEFAFFYFLSFITTPHHRRNSLFCCFLFKYHLNIFV